MPRQPKFALGDVVYDEDRPDTLGIVARSDPAPVVVWEDGSRSGGPGLLRVLRHHFRLNIRVPPGAHTTRAWNRAQAVVAALGRAGIAR